MSSVYALLIIFKMVRFHVCTFNILGPKYFDLMTKEKINAKPVYDPVTLTNPSRKIAIFTQIADMIDRYENIIFCLQEMTGEWHPEFTTYFNKLEYSVHSVLYDVGARDGYQLGILIAVPNCFEIDLESIKTFVVGNQIIKKNLDATAAAAKKNEILMLKLKATEDDTNFVIVTYHMPCDPINQQIAKLHAEIAINLIKSEYTCEHIIFAGDFNTTPDKLAYRFLTETSGMTSIWSTMKLPRFPITNHAFIKGEAFAGCIDHIFFKGKLTCTAVIVHEPPGIIPSKQYPSDHVPVVARFN